MGAEGKMGDTPLRKWVDEDELNGGWAGELYRENPQRQLVLL